MDLTKFHLYIGEEMHRMLTMLHFEKIYTNSIKVYKYAICFAAI